MKSICMRTFGKCALRTLKTTFPALSISNTLLNLQSVRHRDPVIDCQSFSTFYHSFLALTNLPSKRTHTKKQSFVTPCHLGTRKLSQREADKICTDFSLACVNWSKDTVVHWREKHIMSDILCRTGWFVWNKESPHRVGPAEGLWIPQLIFSLTTWGWVTFRMSSDLQTDAFIQLSSIRQTGSQTDRRGHGETRSERVTDR